MIWAIVLIVRRLYLGIALIAIAAGILLLADRAQRRGRPAAADKIARAGLVYFAPEEGADIVINGILEGLRAEGFVEGRNLELLRSHAQGEISNIPALFQNYDNQGLDLILTLTTPCLTAACNSVRKTPVVFSYVYDPLAAGAGPTRNNHVPHVTGVGSFPPVEDTVEVIRKLVPGVRAVGTLYNSSEANSRKVISVAREAFAKRHIKLEEVTVTGTSEVLQAAQVVAGKGVQALWVTGDNTALQAFASIAGVAQRARLPLIINDPEFVDKGALVAVGLGWREPGIAAGKLAARVLRGESPRSLPIEEVAVKRVVLNQALAHKMHVQFPPELIAEAKR